MSEPIDISDMRRAARAVYLATDAPVAEELSRMLASAAREIDQLRQWKSAVAILLARTVNLIGDLEETFSTNGGSTWYSLNDAGANDE